MEMRTMTVKRGLKPMRRWVRTGLVSLLVSGLLLTASAAFAETPDDWEGLNRRIFSFNDFFDRLFLKPLAKTYKKVIPGPVRQGVSNVFDNVDTPATVINQFLQGKPKEGFSDTGRFLVNTTLGIGGIFDVASRMGLPKHQEDFGQTFGVWGAGSGQHVMVPFRGSSTVRDAFGLVLDSLTSPLRFISPREVQYTTYGLYFTDARVGLLAAETLMGGTGDAYLFQRDAFLQRREYLVLDGNVEMEDPFLTDEWDE
jgi:phospholipid-binding lipoprotein MlaA